MERGKREKERKTRTEQFFPFSLKFLLFCLTFFTLCADNFITNFVIYVTNLLTRVTNFVIHVTKFVTNFFYKIGKKIRQKGRIILGKGGNVRHTILI